MEARGSFWSRFASIDSESEADSILEFLDGYGALAPVRELKDHATAALELQPGERVLDVGCGTGIDLLAMAERVRPDGVVVGIDISARAIEQAVARLAGVDGVSAMVADVTELPFDEGGFDACRADRTLQHLAQPELALAELRRVLRPGGRLIVLEVLSELDAPAHPETAELIGSVREHWATSAERQAWLPLMLPLLLARAGFADVGAKVREITSADADVIVGMLAVSEQADRAVAQDGGRAADAEGYARLREAASAGHLTLKMRGVSLLARAGASRPA